MEDGFGDRRAGRDPSVGSADGAGALPLPDLTGPAKPRAIAAETTLGAPPVRPRLRSGLQLAGILLIALNLRPALASVGPLVGEIRADTGLSHAALGLLTALPLLAFGGVSAFSSAVTRRLGFGGALALALLLLTFGASIRATTSTELLYLGTLILGVGIALGNVLLPALVKQDFSHRSGLVTSLYSSILGVGASIGAGVAVPLSRQIGWQNALAVWAIPAIVALLVWLPQVSASERRTRRAAPQSAPLRAMFGSALAWQLALFMGLQSLTFYVIIAWLPDLLQTRGMSPGTAGWMLAMSQIPGVIGAAVIPILAGRVSDQRPIVAALAAIEAVALGGLFFDLGFGPTLLFVGSLGFVLGGTLGLALLFLVLRASDTAATTQLSGMVQAVGYFVAAVGPVIFGWFYELTGGWTVPLLFLVIVLAGKFVTGWSAGRAGQMVGRAG